MLTNLVSNAVRHSAPGGTVTIAVTPFAANAAGAAGIAVAVADTGTGMSGEEGAHAFDRFHKSPESRGSGLGLAIARGLVAAHGGTIELQSAPGRGTTVTFTLPAPLP